MIYSTTFSVIEKYDKKVSIILPSCVEHERDYLDYCTVTSRFKYSEAIAGK